MRLACAKCHTPRSSLIDGLCPHCREIEAMILVCKHHNKPCEEKGFYAEVGSFKYLFCCENGFKQSIEDFGKIEKSNKHGD